VERAAAAVEERFGAIDIWINNAMTSVFSPVIETTADEYRRVTEVTYLGYVYGTLAALRRMAPRDHGTIVQVGSALAYRGIPLQSAYCAAKHAIQGFTDSLRCELLHDRSGVHITSVHLPAVNTPQFRWVKSRLPNEAQPVPPIYQPEIMADAIHHAAHARRREIWVGWPTVKTIAGNRLAPWYADRVLARSGWDDQQLDEPADPDRPYNLWQPVPGDHGAHGMFDDRAQERSVQAWATLHRGALLAAGAVATAAAAAAAVGLLVTRRNGARHALAADDGEDG
jgi:NAD(P)-dependent dehydrogenase (short-subunit alcohol dehydrogenase family)